MTLAQPDQSVSAWYQPEAIAPRGTLVVVPGRGEHAEVYERFGVRLAADGYPVRAVCDPVPYADRALAEIRAAFAGGDGDRPHVLVGSDAGALFAAGLVASGEVSVDGLVLAGLPTDRHAPTVDSWEHEAYLRTACPTHRTRLTKDRSLRRGVLARPLPAAWFDRAASRAIRLPTLGLHGADDRVSPFDAVHPWYAALPAGRLVRITGGRHDALNDQTHRSAAATIVLFLEQLRTGDPTPITIDVTRTDLP